MKTTPIAHRPRPVVTQVQNNTSLWIGRLQTDTTDHYAGQTFICPANGALDNIQVYSATVQTPGELVLTLHQFDAENKNWGPILATGVLNVDKSDEDKWIRFDLPAAPLQKDQTYGFRLNANAMIALGEAAVGNKNPFTGEEWHADSKNQEGNFYHHFSLTYKVEMFD